LLATNPAMRPKTIQPMMDIGSLRFADFNGAFCTGIIPPVPFFPKRQCLRLQTKCDYESNRHRKHHTKFEQVFYPSALAAKQQILKYHLMKYQKRERGFYDPGNLCPIYVRSMGL
jgi:hypothetical protein